MPQNVFAAPSMEEEMGNDNSPADRASAHYVYDPKTKKVLSAKNEHMLIHPASLTKLATATCFYHFKKNDLFSSSDEAVRRIEKDLERALIVSDNFAAHRVAFFLNGQKSIRELLQKGMGVRHHDTYNKLVVNPIMREVVGLEQSEFTNGSGLLGGGSKNTKDISTASWHNKATAYELSLLCDYIREHHPEILEITGQPDIKDRNGKIACHNSNPLLEHNKRYDAQPYGGVKWGKTGHLYSSGYNLIVGAEKNGLELVVISMGSKNKLARIKNVTKLLDDGFQKLLDLQPVNTLQPAGITTLSY